MRQHDCNEKLRKLFLHCLTAVNIFSFLNPIFQYNVTEWKPPIVMQLIFLLFHAEQTLEAWLNLAQSMAFLNHS